MVVAAQSRREPRTGVIAVLALATTIVAGCGGNPSTESGPTAADAHAQEVFDQVDQLSGQERTDTLVRMAEEEGALSLYTSNTDIQDIIDGFEDAYDIDVEVYRGNSESVLQRVLQEAKAQYHGVDLVETNSGELDVLNQEKLLYPYAGELREEVRPEGQADGWTADRFNVFVVGWNSDRVKPADAPASLEELAEPQWKGRTSMEVGDIDWFATMYEYYLEQGMSTDEVDDLFSGLAANAKIAKGHTVQGELLSAGQFDVALSIYSHTVDGAEHEGAPVTWRPAGVAPVQPLVIRPNGAGLMTTAQHPAAAVLFMDYLLTEGQDLIATSFRIGSVPTEDDPLEGLQVIEVDEDEMLQNGREWDRRYADLVENGSPAD